MSDALRPATLEELRDAIAGAARAGSKLRLRGGGSKDAVGAPTPEVAALDMREFSGIIEYDPPELVLTARAGTPLSDVNDAVASQGQMLAFDPYDHGPMFGALPGAATIGGIVAAGVSGSQRLSRGAARDHLLGFEAVSGAGEIFKAGSKVVKNVTGFDLSKLVAGSWGRLVALTQVTLKVVPRPQVQETMVMHGLDPAAAVAAMAQAVGSPAGVSAAAHLPDREGAPMTLFRVDGFAESVAARKRSLEAVLADVGSAETLDGETGVSLWEQIRTAAPLPVDRPLWRIVVAPRKAPAVVEMLGDARWILDWAGGLIWAATTAEAGVLRAAAEAAGGHAMLIRADAILRAKTAALHPPARGVVALEKSIRRAFDPENVFDCGRF
ncbi:MAG TPA: glycolate oxidase subunit GlcE [Rhodothermales bacterium]